MTFTGGKRDGGNREKRRRRRKRSETDYGKEGAKGVGGKKRG